MANQNTENTPEGTQIRTNAVLVNCAQRSEQSPDTFAVPELSEIEDLRPGDHVKVIVQFDATKTAETVDALIRRRFENHFGIRPKQIGGERFWVKIADVVRTDAGLKFTGVVDNDLAYTRNHGLRCGDAIELGPEHVMAVHLSPRLTP